MSVRPFIDTLRDVESGTLLEELSEIQNEVIAACQKTLKGGEITIKLSYKPEGEGQMTISADFKHKAPTMPRGKTLFFVTPERNLTRQDPRQQNLALRAVDSPAQATELREVSNA